MRQWIPHSARCIPWIALALLAAGPAASQTVTSRPGTLTGVVSLGSEAVTWGQVYANADDGSYYLAELSGGEPSYTLTVEGGRPYHIQLAAYVDNGSGSTYLSVYGWRQSIEVPPGSTVTHDFSYDVARISGTINVIGGAVSSYTLIASANEGDEEYVTTSAKDGTSSFSLPMVLDGDVEISGSTVITLPSGASVTLPLEPRTLSLGAGGASLGWTLDTTRLLGTITANMSLSGPDIVRSHTLSLQTSAASAGVAELYSSSGSHDFSPLAAGDYFLGASTYFDAPYGYLLYPWQDVTLAPEGAETRSFGGDLAFLRGDLDVQGFHTFADLSSATVRAARSEETGYWTAHDDVDLSSGELDLATVAGTWTISGYDIYIHEPDPTTPAEVWLSNNSNLSEPISLSAGEDVGGQDIQLTTVSTQMVYDVAPFLGAPESVSSPRLHGWEENGTSFQAVGREAELLNPMLQIIASPGTYDVYASATVAGAVITLTHFPLRIKAPVALDVGGDAPLVAFTELVPDHPEHAVTLDFGQIDAPGPVAVTASPVGLAPPPGFMTTVGGAPIVYHSITTQAEFTPPVRVCLSYSQAELTASDETDLRMLRLADSTADGEYNPGWHVMTELDGAEADVDANFLCASTDSLSIFALMQLDHAGQGDADQDGVPDGADNCPLLANADQSDADADGAGDACDNCPLDPNPGQGDADANGLGDACEPVCVTIERGVSGGVADAYISTGEPNNRTGAYEFLGTGLHSSGEKMSLLAFDVGAIPGNATVQSATLSLSMQWQATSGVVEAHAITAPWSEATVTSSSFGGAFDPAVEASFVAPAGIDARQSCDVTALTQAWVDGSLPNHGVLLREPGPNKHSFRSSEHARSDAHPGLDVCYVTP
ncbi:DNRLRE domain-containing protein [Sorangium sp. So ce1151]|uniref:DNRLRE domain-containing protein n=1 Tax=Sorangium sp. So ce1151 TaxID=3133332 RepID=UPI003F5F9943